MTHGISAVVWNLMDRLAQQAGGPARRSVVIILACVLGLSSADSATVGAIAAPLQSAWHIGNAEIGLLVSVTSFAGAIGTVPAGFLADRMDRTRLLATSIALWSAMMVVSAAAPSYLGLLVSRILLGVVVAVAGPTVASLTGDYFRAEVRGRVYGLILAGELIGAGAGYVISGDIAGILSWRASFAILALPGIALAIIVWRRLPEPSRGGGASDQPNNRLSPAAAIKYVLRIRTNNILIISSALGYFYFSGLRTFALLFVRGHFGLGQAAASSLLPVIGVGAIFGVLTGGRIADQLARRGHVHARLTIPAIAFGAAAVALGGGLTVDELGLALPLFVVGAGMVGAANPPLDAARLDIVPFRFWGRAEAIRTVLRTVAEGTAPLVFGIVADQFTAGRPRGTPTGLGGFNPATAAMIGRGLQYTLLIMLGSLIAAGAFLWLGRSTYVRDTRAATRSVSHSSPPDPEFPRRA